MAIVHESSAALEASIVPTAGARRLQRVAEVRQEQGISLRSVSRQMGKTVSVVRAEENEANDLTISQLMQWQEVLGVPLQDLLVDPSPTLSQPVLNRARLLRVMKTVAAIQETTEPSSGPNRLATMLAQQLIEIMPELEHVSAWHSVGQRRSLDEFGRVVERRVSDDLFTQSPNTA